MPPSRLGCPMSQKTPNMGNPGSLQSSGDRKPRRREPSSHPQVGPWPTARSRRRPRCSDPSVAPSACRPVAPCETIPTLSSHSPPIVIERSGLVVEAGVFLPVAEWPFSSHPVLTEVGQCGIRGVAVDDAEKGATPPAAQAVPLMPCGCATDARLPLLAIVAIRPPWRSVHIEGLSPLDTSIGL